MQIYKTQNAELAEKLYGLGFDYVLERINDNQPVFCFLGDDNFINSVNSFGIDLSEFFISDTLSF